MIKKWLLCLIVFVGMGGCTPPTGSGIDPTRPAKSTPFPIGQTFIRLQNETPVDFSMVEAIYPNSLATFGDVTAGILTDYQPIDEAYQMPAFHAVSAEREYHTDVLDAPVETGEPPITAGYYTIIMRMADDAIFGELRPDAEPAEATLAELLSTLREQGLDVTLEPLIQRGTIFDELAGETISNQQILRINQARVDAFIFQSGQTAEKFAATIQPGGSSFLFVRDDGEEIERFERAGIGSSLTWWQTGRFIFNYNGSDVLLSDQITQALGAEPLQVAQAQAGALNIRVSNIGDTDFDQLRIRFPNGEADYGAVPAFSTSGYLPVDQAYHYAGITIMVDGTEHQTSPIDYVGETPLNAGNYSYIIQLVDGEFRQTVINDDTPFLPDELVGKAFYFVAAQSADDELFLPHGNENLIPWIQFTPEITQNSGESGFIFTGNAGCNGMFGTYHVTEYSTVVIQGVGSTAVLCAESVMQTENFIHNNLAGISYYLLQGDFLYWLSATGDRLILTTERPTTLPPYPASESAGIAPILLALQPEVWELNATKLEQQGDVAPETVVWEVTFFREQVQVLVFPDSAKATTAWQDESEKDGQSWLYDNFIIRYDGDYYLVNEVLDNHFAQ